MIGHFSDEGAAKETLRLIETLREAVGRDPSMAEVPSGDRGFTPEMLDLLLKLKVHSLAPGEPEQFGYDYTISRSKRDLTVSTDEIDVLGILKVMIDGGARVEVYSAHHYPNLDAEGSSGAA